MNSQIKQVKVTLIRSLSGRLPRHVACAHGLGLRKINQTIILSLNDCNRGMINKISYLLNIEESAS
jgi:large subunit ribosomal protein L30